MKDQPQILILGYGEMGHAMEHLLCHRSASEHVHIWDKYPPAGFTSINLEDGVPQADVIMNCLPVTPYREVLNSIAPLLKADCLCIGLAKGLDSQGQCAAHVFADVLKNNHNYALLYGPMISEEIRAGRFSFAQVLCEKENTYDRVSQLFLQTRLVLTHTADIKGASWAAILKNIYAPLIGISDELQMGDNVRGYLVSACLHEMDQIVRNKGGLSGTAFQAAGLADLITTATSEGSHHYTLGRRLARGDTTDISGEGVHSLEMIKQHQLLNVSNYPLMQCIALCIERPVDCHQFIEELFASKGDASLTS